MGEEAAMEGNAAFFRVLVGLETPLVLRAAIHLGILDMISSSPASKLSPAAIAQQLPCNNPNLHFIRCIMRFLSFTGLLVPHQADKGDTEYSLGVGVEAAFVKRIKGSGEPNEGRLVEALQLDTHEVVLKAWEKVAESVLKGPPSTPFKEAHNGHDMYSLAMQDPPLFALFNTAMAAITSSNTDPILRVYSHGFEALNERGLTLLDVGGGNGTTISQIVQKYPCIKAINFDLPSVLSHAPAFPGVRHVPGDMFHHIPHAHTILIKHVLHNWDDDKCVEILKCCYRALPDDGVLVIADTVIATQNEGDDSERSRLAGALDMVMMVTMSNGGGGARNEKEFISLVRRAGFDQPRVTHVSPIPLTILECSKSP